MQGDSYFLSEARQQYLAQVAQVWLGTPWLPNSASVGAGVSCHNLPRCIYIGCGFLDPGFPVVVGDPTQDAHSKVSRMAEFLDTRSEFKRAEVNEIRPGDLLGIRIRRCIDHLGVAIDRHYFIHTLMHKHTSLDLHGVAPWSQRIEAVWRPIER